MIHPLQPRIERLEPRRLFALFTLDPTFGDGGLVSNPLGDHATAAHLIGFVDAQSDDKILVAGFASDGARLARYNTDGTFDTSYNGDGADVTGEENDGEVGTWTAILIRFNSNGSPDTTFGGDGIVTRTLFDGNIGSSGNEPNVTALAIDAAGHLLTGGNMPEQLYLA